MSEEIQLDVEQIQKVLQHKKKIEEAKQSLTNYLEGLADGMGIDTSVYVFDIDKLIFREKEV